MENFRCLDRSVGAFRLRVIGGLTLAGLGCLFKTHLEKTLRPNIERMVFEKNSMMERIAKTQRFEGAPMPKPISFPFGVKE